MLGFLLESIVRDVRTSHCISILSIPVPDYSGVLGACLVIVADNRRKTDDAGDFRREHFH